MFFLLVISACKKSGNSGQAASGDCQTNNYGVLEVTFTDAAHRHTVTVQEYIIGSVNPPVYLDSPRVKIFPIGTLSDTLHLTPSLSGDAYTGYYNTTDFNGSSTSASFGIIQCHTTTQSINF